MRWSFGPIAEQTAPGEAFTRAVLAALPAGSGAGAGPLAWKLASTLGKGLALLSGAVLGGLSGLAGVFFGMRMAMRAARDDEERRGLWRLGAVQGLLVLSAAGFSFFDRGVALAGWLAFIVGLNVSFLVWMPKIVARRIAAERAEDPCACQRQRRRAVLRAVGLTVGTGTSLAAVLYNFIRR